MFITRSRWSSATVATVVGDKVTSPTDTHQIQTANATQMDPPPTARTFTGHAVASRVLSHMLEHASDPSQSDLQVHAGQKTFPCHRAVLCASSPVFSAMFASQMQEPTTGQLTLTDVSAPVFAPIRAYLYGRPLIVHDDHALAISAFIRRYEIALHELTDFLDALLTSALTLDNVLLVRDHADAHDAHRLRRNCDRFITARMRLLPETPSFLSSAPAAALAALHAPCNVSRAVLGRKCAQYVLAAAVAWLAAEEGSRESWRDPVLGAVDVDGLSLPALVRASRDPTALKSPPFQVRLLRAFATKAERDLNFGPLAGAAVDAAALSGERGRRGYAGGELDLFPYRASQGLYHTRRRLGLGLAASQRSRRPSSLFLESRTSNSSETDEL